MKTNISLPKDDRCKLCDDNRNCPENVYDCIILNDAINTKTAAYIWTWVRNPKKK